MAVQQSVLLTAIPSGGSVGDGYNVMCHIAPRLLTTGALQDYAQWLDWPATLAGARWQVSFPTLGRTFAATPVATLPDSARWQAIFHPDTKVNGHKYKGYDHRRVYSYPVQHVVDFMKQRWGKFGVNDPTEPPTYANLMDEANGFGRIEFESLGDLKETGPTRKRRLTTALAAAMDPVSNDPTKWAIPFDTQPLPADPQLAKDVVAKRFLQLERFHTRGRKQTEAPLPDTTFVTDFHVIVTMCRQYPMLQRLLGLTVMLRFQPGRVALTSPAGGTPVKVILTPATAIPQVGARTMCQVGAGIPFRALPTAASDMAPEGYLKVGDTSRFRTVEIDPDGAAIKSMQFADNVARSRLDKNPGKKFSRFTADRYHLPAHASAGLSITRLGRSTGQAKLFKRHLDLNTAGFTATGAPSGTDPVLFAEDLVQGWRFDVRQDLGGRLVWRSLQATTGKYEFLADASLNVEVAEEGHTRGAASTSGGAADNGDLYLGESMMRWTGWSLAARMLGKSLGANDELVDDPDATPPDPEFDFKSTINVSPGSLPKLRYGETYALRARTVNIAGESVPFSADGSATPPPSTVTPDVEYRRYEPVASPLSVLRTRPTIPGESSDIVVIRSETFASPTPSTTDRHLVPPRAAYQLAEHHGKIEELLAGGASPATVFALLAQLDSEDLSTHPDGSPVDPAAPDGARYFDVADLALNYMPDPLARSIRVLGLPASPQTTVALPLENAGSAPWPKFETYRLNLTYSAAAGWTHQPANHVLDVKLDVADDIDVKISSQFGAGDLDLLGVWQWIVAWFNAHGGPTPLATLTALANRGEHWMLTPSRTLRLVHAVRTPKFAPSASQLLVNRPSAPLGRTYATVQRLVTSHRKSTGRLDLVGKWAMPVDTGPRGNAHPDTDTQAFESVAMSVEVDHRAKPAGNPDSIEFIGRHEFNDTKFRKVDYRVVATTPFADFFREETTVNMAGTAPVLVDARGLEPETVTVRMPGGQELRQGPAADYVVDGPAGTIRKTAGSGITTPTSLVVSYVAPEIHQTSVVEHRTILSSARPAAPKLEYVIPAFRWTGDGSPTSPSVREGNFVRVYLARPWWSSGAQEKLGVVLWKPGSGQVDPPAASKPYVSGWGFDPAFKSSPVSNAPALSSFPRATATATALPLTEAAGQTVDIAGHDVAFDAERDLWYCDIELNFGAQNRSYFPFVRLALVRYQPNSIPGAHLSSVVLTDFFQTTPRRATTVSRGSGGARLVTVAGPAFSADSARTGPSSMVVTLETARSGVSDPNLKWRTVTGRAVVNPVTLKSSVNIADLASWSGNITVPATGGPYRLVVQEIEVHRTGSETPITPSPYGRRVVFTDIIEL